MFISLLTVRLHCMLFNQPPLWTKVLVPRSFSPGYPLMWVSR
ncbi:hypothetical protein E2C01_079437 [Portunus trituberculatus]|uniref:Uncharacterized protein n=1 Tax=Portunus trituberculatus TaxID=210409 RepID=A0A5B7IGY4_PORTR|nr:hypothetical protein [Portunus trituberculatus]